MVLLGIVMIFYLIRHGESLFNAQRRIQGQSDVALSPLGHRQSAALAEALAAVPLDAVYASPLSRALETARPIAARQNLELRTDERLKEIHAGIFQGLLWSEIEASHPAEAVRWRQYDPDFVIPGGESRRALMVRGGEVLRSIREAGHDHVAVVAHGGLIGAALKAVLEIPAALHPFSLYNASISKLVWGTRLQLLTLNQIDHLRAAGLANEEFTGDL